MTIIENIQESVFAVTTYHDDLGTNKLYQEIKNGTIENIPNPHAVSYTDIEHQYNDYLDNEYF